jgi:hypothetical protein
MRSETVGVSCVRKAASSVGWRVASMRSKVSASDGLAGSRSSTCARAWRMAAGPTTAGGLLGCRAAAVWGEALLDLCGRLSDLAGVGGPGWPKALPGPA